MNKNDIFNLALAKKMSGGGGGHTILGTKTVTENGTYVALDDEFDGYSTVTVALPLNSKSITANGTYLASSDELEGYTDVTVNVSPNVGTKTITENGTYLASSDNKDGYSEVTVNLPSLPQAEEATF